MVGRLPDIEIENILHNNIVGRLGCTNGQSVYVVPMNYVYTGKYILAHSTEGKKITYMRANPEVCFEVDEVDDIMNWRSVILWGKFEEVEDELEKEHILEELVQHMMKLKVSDASLMPHLSENRVRPHQPGYIKVVVWRIAVNKKSGRFEKN
ncbi:MAG TPA: pyridoxamine 5'-phosphate oxidase family protein [Chitinophagaceae bacterium]|nr:pyridoxamine 5'-phosphate oxidase family protein [Chitinophagaceae bacterium]